MDEGVDSDRLETTGQNMTNRVCCHFTVWLWCTLAHERGMFPSAIMGVESNRCQRTWMAGQPK